MSEKDKKSCIIFGIGNCGRQDDGLGWAFLDTLNKSGFKKATLEYRYQLQIEDAELICNYDAVLFVDASKNDLIKGYRYEVCKASNKHGFSTHTLAPETILYLARQLYGHTPKAHVLAIQGYEWELRNGMTINAAVNLNAALVFFNKRYADTLLKPEHDKSHN
ncbi:MAG: hydrogenase maturation protease [Maribacter sp.]|uniref:hydrogenase maturation protease n=1 Tax=Maribacter sp. TaxID=1897614 RepID=UPI003C746FEF